MRDLNPRDFRLRVFEMMQSGMVAVRKIKSYSTGSEDSISAARIETEVVISVIRSS